MLVANYRKAYLELIDDIVNCRLTAVNEQQIKRRFSGLFEELHKSYRLYESEVRSIIDIFAEDFAGLDPKALAPEKNLEKTYFRHYEDDLGLRLISARNKLFTGILNKMNSAYLLHKDIHDCVGFKIVIDDASTPEVPFESLNKKRSIDDLISYIRSEDGFRQLDEEKLAGGSFDSAFKEFIRFYLEKYEKKNEKAAEDASKWFLENIDATDWKIKKDISDMVFSYKGRKCTATSQQMIKIGSPEENFFLDIIHFKEPKTAKEYIKYMANYFKEVYERKDGEIVEFGHVDGRLKRAKQSFYIVERLTEDLDQSIVMGRDENLVAGFRKMSGNGTFKKFILGKENSLLDIVLSKVHDEQRRYTAKDERLLPSGILPGKKEHSAINFKLKDFEIPREYVAKQTIDPKILHRIYDLDFVDSGSPFRDYIKHPKSNNYRAIHGILINGSQNFREPIEFQIATSFRYFDSKYGEASHQGHVKYKLEKIDLVKRLSLNGNKKKIYNRVIRAIKASIRESYESEISRCVKALKGKESGQCYNEALMLLSMLKKEMPERSFSSLETELRSLQPGA